MCYATHAVQKEGCPTEDYSSLLLNNLTNTFAFPEKKEEGRVACATRSLVKLLPKLILTLDETLPDIGELGNHFLTDAFD
jgi:hypothetical protein